MTQSPRRQSLNVQNYRQAPPPRIKHDKCTLCGLCTLCCHVMEERNKKIAVLRPDLCLRCGHCASVCPSDAIVGPAMEEKRVTDRARAAAPSASSLQFLLRSRRSVRQYQKKPISQKDMDKILEAGRYTPTGLNVQNIQYLVLTDPHKIERLTKMTMPALLKLFGMAVRISKIPVLGDRMLGENSAENFQKHYAPALKAIDECLKRGEKDMLFHSAPAIMLVHGEKHDDTAFSCSAALFSCMLMADTMGIGCCLNGFLVLVANHDREVNKWLGIPKRHKVHAAMTLGYKKLKYNRLVKRNPVKVRYL